MKLFTGGNSEGRIEGRRLAKVCLLAGLLLPLSVVALNAPIVGGNFAHAQEMLPADNGLATYHTAPRYRESESHPLRIVGYILHPVGWVAREVIFRPFSYFASSTETTRSVLGFREPFDYRQPECFSADDSSPDCRSVMPFNYDTQGQGSLPTGATSEEVSFVPMTGERHVFFPDVNFDFNSRALNDLGKGRVRQIAQLLNKTPGMKIVLQGNTDYVGPPEYNEKLGMDRADAVRTELVSLGVSSDYLSTVTFGESQPIFAEEENWARAVNRRVEVKLGSQELPTGSNAATSDSWQVAE